MWRPWIYKMLRYISSSVLLRLSQFSQSSLMQYMGLSVFSLPVSRVMIEQLCVLHFIIIISSEEWVTSHCSRLGHETMGKFDCGVRYVIIFQYVQFLIRLAAVSYRGEKVRTVVCPAVRSVNKSSDTRNCVQNGAEYTICVLFTTRLYYKALGIILCTLICQIRRNYNRLDDDHCDVTDHRKMSALGTAGAMVTTHDNSLVMWSFEGPKLFSVL